MPKLTMTQWWERLEANLNYLSSTLDPQARENLQNSDPWKAAMSMAVKGKVIEEKGLWFAITNGAQVEKDMKKLAEGLGEEGLPNVNDTTSFLFALCYAEYMPLYRDIESSVPFITGFLQKPENADLVAKRCRIVRDRLTRFYEANREAVEAIPGIRQMPGINFLNLPQEKSAADEEFSLATIEKDLKALSLKCKTTKEHRAKISENINTVRAFFFALKQNSSGIEEMLPKIVEIISTHRRDADGDLIKTRNCDQMLAQLNNLVPGYLPRGLLDKLPKKFRGPSYNETKVELLQGLTKVYFPQVTEALKNAEKELESVTTELHFAQQKMEYWVSLERVKAAEFFKTHYFTLNSESPDVEEMTAFSLKLLELIEALNVAKQAGTFTKNGEPVPAPLLERMQTIINPASSQMIDYLLREKKDVLDRLAQDAVRARGLIDRYCDAYTAAQDIRDNQVQLSFIQYLAAKFTLIRGILSILPGWLSNSTLAAVEQYNENNRQVAALEKSIKKILPEIQAKSMAKPVVDQNPHYTLAGKLKAAFFGAETTVDKTDPLESEATLVLK